MVNCMKIWLSTTGYSTPVNYQDILLKHGISDQTIDALANTFRQRATDQTPLCHPDAVYHTAAIDIAMGVIDLHQETKAGLNEDHSAKEWLSILTGISLPASE